MKRLDDEREARHLAELERRDKELAATNKKIEDLANRPPTGSDTELGVIKDLGGKALDKLDKGIGELVGLAKTNLPPLGRTEKANLQAGLKEAAGTKPVVSGEVPADVKEGLSKYR